MTRMTETEQDGLLTPPEAARWLRISERKLWGLTSPRGPIPRVKIGQHVRYLRADLERFAAAMRETIS